MVVAISNVKIANFTLLEDKSVSYKTALEVLCELCPDFKPKTGMVDFETGEHSAVRSVFPTAVIKGCLTVTCGHHMIPVIMTWCDMILNKLHLV